MRRCVLQGRRDGLSSLLRCSQLSQQVLHICRNLGRCKALLRGHRCARIIASAIPVHTKASVHAQSLLEPAATCSPALGLHVSLRLRA